MWRKVNTYKVSEQEMNVVTLDDFFRQDVECANVEQQGIVERGKIVTKDQTSLNLVMDHKKEDLKILHNPLKKKHSTSNSSKEKIPLPKKLKKTPQDQGKEEQSKKRYQAEGGKQLTFWLTSSCTLMMKILQTMTLNDLNFLTESWTNFTNKLMIDNKNNFRPEAIMETKAMMAMIFLIFKTKKKMSPLKTSLSSLLKETAAFCSWKYTNPQVSLIITLFCKGYLITKKEKVNPQNIEESTSLPCPTMPPRPTNSSFVEQSPLPGTSKSSSLSSFINWQEKGKQFSVKLPENDGDFTVKLELFRTQDLEDLAPQEWWKHALHRSRVRLDANQKIAEPLKQYIADLEKELLGGPEDHTQDECRCNRNGRAEDRRLQSRGPLFESTWEEFLGCIENNRFRIDFCNLLIVMKRFLNIPMSSLPYSSDWFKLNVLQSINPNGRLFHNALRCYENEIKYASLQTLYDIQTADGISHVYSAGSSESVSTVYWTFNQSLAMLIDLLHFQYNGDLNEIKKFLKTTADIFEMKSDNINSLLITGSESSGKYLFFRGVCDFSLNPGQIKNPNRNNKIPFVGCHNKRTILWDECRCDRPVDKTVRNLLQGKRFTTKLRCKNNPVDLGRTPIFILADSYPFTAEQRFEDSIYCQNWRTCERLKRYEEKQPYPLAHGCLLLWGRQQLSAQMENKIIQIYNMVKNTYSS